MAPTSEAIPVIRTRGLCRSFAMGATMMIEDYAKGTTRKLLIIGAVSLAWVIAATGLFALVRIAL